MQKFTTSLVTMVASAMAGGIILPPSSKEGTSVALILINGMSCDPEAYEPLVEEL